MYKRFHSAHFEAAMQNAEKQNPTGTVGGLTCLSSMLLRPRNGQGDIETLRNKWTYLGTGFGGISGSLRASFQNGTITGR